MMDKYDPNLASRVWQRVYPQTQEMDNHGELRRFLTAEAEAAAVYARLSQKYPGSAQTLRQMSDDAKRNVRRLKGICYLQTGACPATAKMPARQESAEAALRRCYGESLRWAAVCRGLTDDEEYGCVYEDIAKMKREHCLKILEILGTLP